MRPVLRFTPLLALCIAPSLRAQVLWEWVPRIDHRYAHGMAPDLVGGGVLLFGGPNDDTWRWDGTGWQRLAPSAAPSPRHSFAMAADLARGRIVLFGGNGVGAGNDTWEWDGVTWTQQAPGITPPARFAHAGAYDLARQRFVVFGGWDSTVGALLADTWEWDGSVWQQRTPSAAPPPRRWHSMAYDLVRRRVVLFGGEDATTVLGDTWEWDGTSWTQRTPASGPPARAAAAMTFDPARQRVVMSGGGGAAFFGDTWEWDGATWTQVATTGPPNRRWSAMAATPNGRSIVLFGGESPVRGYLADTWEWSGGAWVERQDTTLGTRMEHAMAFDPAGGTPLLFGGLPGPGNDTWSWTGDRWRELQPEATPPRRNAHAMASDARRGRVVLFGGRNPRGGTAPMYMLGDTWTWDGSEWSAERTSTAPQPRAWHRMAEDTGRTRVVLFGGWIGTSVIGDTWEWDGSQWQRMQLSTGAPPSRYLHALAYDAARQRTVLFGGWSFGPILSDTWEWDGTSWTQRFPATVPPPRVQHAMVYDPARRRVVMFGGMRPVGGGVAQTLIYDDTWEWDGTDWSLRAPSGSPGARSLHVLEYDRTTERVLLFGGLGQRDPRVSPGSAVSGTFLYGPVNPASFTNFGNGCRGSMGVPSLKAAPFSLPWTGDTFSVELGNLPAGSSPWMAAGFARTMIPIAVLPGCTQLVTPDAAVPLPLTGNVATWTVTVPANPALVGGSLFLQGAALNAGGMNAFGAVLSGGGQATVGMR